MMPTFPALLTLSRTHIGICALAKYIPECRMRAHDCRPAWDEAIAALQLHEWDVFEAEGRTTEHPPWAPLSNRPLPFLRVGGVAVGYATWKRHFYPGRKILELVGKLKRQLTGLEPGAHVERRARSFTYGSNYPLPGGEDLGGLHAEGRAAKPGKIGAGGVPGMPARPPLRLDQPAIDNITEPVLTHIWNWW